jgi:hypothetical protein
VFRMILTINSDCSPKSVLSSERMLRKDYDCKGSVDNEVYGRESEGA